MVKSILKKIRENYEKYGEDVFVDPVLVILGIVILWILITKVT